MSATNWFYFAPSLKVVAGLQTEAPTPTEGLQRRVRGQETRAQQSQETRAQQSQETRAQQSQETRAQRVETRGRRVAAIIVLMLLGLCCSSPLDAAIESAPSIGKISLGLNGHYKAGYWTPVHVPLQGGSAPFRGDIQIIVPDGDGVATRFLHRDLPSFELAPGESRTLVRLVKLGRANGTVTVELHSGDKVVARREFTAFELSRPIVPEHEFIATYGSPLDISDAIGRTSRFAADIDVCEISGHDQLPDQWLGFEAVDSLIVTTSDLTKFESISSAQINALREWVLNGGRLVLCIGKNATKLLGQEGGFAELVPGKFQQINTLRNLSALETFAGSAQRLELSDGADSGIPITVLADVIGKVEVADTTGINSRPLVVRAPFGFGETVFVAFDLDRPPFANWEGRGRILSQLLRESNEEKERRSNTESTTHVARFGYQDMVGQLRSGLDQFPEVTFVPFSWIAGLVLLYILVIVPADYFFLRDIVRRMTLTWLTFPVVTVVFVALALGLSSKWKGSQTHLNQVDLVDVDLSTGALRGTTWAHLYSPSAATYKMRCEPAKQIAEVTTIGGNILSWQGLPGTGLGGLNTAAAAPPAIDEYQFQLESPWHTTMQGVPIHIASTKSLLERWWGQTKIADASSLSVDSDGLLRGELTNPLPIKLTDCVVYFENWAYRLDTKSGTLQPGQSTRIENERALNLQWRLTGRRVIETKDFSTPWDQHTLVVPRIVEMMMFHSAAGGKTYTQLVNRYQSYVDLSSHLTVGRAILIGRSDSAAINLVLNDREVKADRQWTHYRIVLPVGNPRRN